MRKGEFGRCLLGLLVRLGLGWGLHEVYGSTEVDEVGMWGCGRLDMAV